jgi:O-antigen/teichoic acid export membrane protein
VALPLAMASGATTLYMNLDTVLLGSLGSITATGWYNLAAKLTGILLVPTSLLSLAIFPAFASTAANVDQVFRRRWEEWSVHLAAIGVFAAAVVFAGAGRIIDILFGSAFHPAALALRILMITVVLIYLYTPLYQAMIVFNQQGRLFWLLAAATVLNLGLNVLLIPRYSLYGAAWATVATHIALLGGLYALVGRFTPLAPVSTGLLTGFLTVMLSGIPAYLIVQVSTVSLSLTIPPAGLAFLCCFFGLRRIAPLAPQTSR